MNKKQILIFAGVILLLAAFMYLITSGGFEALAECGLNFDCYLPDEITAVETGIVLLVIGVLLLLTSTSIGRQPGD